MTQDQIRQFKTLGAGLRRLPIVAYFWIFSFLAIFYCLIYHCQGPNGRMGIKLSTVICNCIISIADLINSHFFGKSIFQTKGPKNDINPIVVSKIRTSNMGPSKIMSVYIMTLMTGKVVQYQYNSHCTYSRLAVFYTIICKI